MTIPLIDVRAPSDQAEGTRLQVLRWLKRPGDIVALNEPLLEIETDKVTVEVPATASGVLREILKDERQEVAPGDLLARLAPIHDEPGIHAVLDEPSVPDGPPPVNLAPTSSDHVDGPSPLALDQGGGAENSARQRLSPAVRRVLRERQIDPAWIRGTGKGGRITMADVEGMSGVNAPTSLVLPGDPRIERVAHSPMRRRIADRMVESLLHTAPHVTTVFEADMSAVLAHRAAHRDAFARKGASLTLSAYLAEACIDAIRAVPEVNSHWTADALEVYRQVNLGIATALGQRGLVVPVVRNADALDLFGLAEAIEQLTRRARENRLDPSDVQSGTFTISNHGVSGSLLATPIIINQPQSAILGVGKVEKRVVVTNANGLDAIAIQPRCYLTLTIDHRVMDGATANRFLSTMVEHLEAWRE